MVLEAPGHRCALPSDRCPRPAPASSDPGLGLRLCRTDLHILDGEVVARRARRVCSATRSSGSDRGHGRAGRHPVAGLDVRRLCSAVRPREPLRPRALHRLHLDGGFAELVVADERYCFAAPRGYPDAAGRPAAVRRPDRLPVAADGRATPTCRALTGSARPPTSSPGRASTGPRGLCFHARRAMPRPSASRASSAPTGPAPRTSTAEALDAAIIFAPAGALVPAALRGGGKGGTWSAAAST